jgi:glyoxylase-like metal-dependent hydrolase (beta-lactamase superfamily II)
MDNLVYLLHDQDTGRAAVLDPAWDVPAILQLAQSLDARITDILLTHSHHDHINGVAGILAQADAELHLLKAEAAFWAAPLQRPSLHRGGDALRFGAHSLQILHTPGHTPGSACYQVGNHLFTGDTVFVYGCGRCDLHGGDPEQMFHTLRRLVTELPATLNLLPGHDYASQPMSSWAEQCAGNPFLHFTALDRFIHYRMHLHDRHRDSPYAPVSPAELASFMAAAPS